MWAIAGILKLVASKPLHKPLAFVQRQPAEPKEHYQGWG